MKFVDRPSPNFDARLTPIDLVVLHYTGMQDAETALRRLTDPAPKAGGYKGPWQAADVAPETPLGRAISPTPGCVDPTSRGPDFTTERRLSASCSSAFAAARGSNTVASVSIPGVLPAEWITMLPLSTVRDTGSLGADSRGAEATGAA